MEEEDMPRGGVTQNDINDPYGTKLINVINDNDFPTLEALVENGFDVNKNINCDGNIHATPLIFACGFLNKPGNIQIARYVLEAGANPNTLYGEDGSKDGFPLHIACSHGDTEMIRLLLEYGVYIDAPLSADEATPLMTAVSMGQEDVARLLLDSGADVHAISETSERTVLHWAAENGHANTTILVLKWGGMEDLEKRDWWGRTLFMAALGKRNRLVRGQVHWHEARKATVALLMESGANVLAIDGDRKTALHYAAVYGDPSIITVLAERGVEIDARALPLENIVGRPGSTALHYTAESWSPEVVETLLNLGANIEETDAFGKTPLHHAVWNRGNPSNNNYYQDSFNTTKLLLERGARVDTQDLNGRTPLHYAGGFRASGEFGESQPTVGLLLEHGADTTILDNDGISGRKLFDLIATKTR